MKNIIGIDKEKANELSRELNDLLANYQLFYQNLRGLHWNIKGKEFFELHVKFEELYNDAVIKVDEIAERILTLEGEPLHTYSDYLQVAEIKEEESDLQSIKDGRDGWLVNLNLEPERDSIVNWMTGFGSEGMHGDSVMKLDEDSEKELMHPEVRSGLAPPDLIDSSVQLDTEYKKEKEKAKDEMRNSQRIQIAGKLYL